MDKAENGNKYPRCVGMQKEHPMIEVSFEVSLESQKIAIEYMKNQEAAFHKPKKEFNNYFPSVCKCQCHKKH